jgi:2-methylcitrate dehydratase
VAGQREDREYPGVVLVVDPAEQRRFLSAVDALADLESTEALNVVIDPRLLDGAPVIPPGIFG